MKITCESCGAHYDLDEARIPPSGITMKCPACMHTFPVRRGAAPPPPAAIALSAGPGDDDSDLPAPVGHNPDIIDLPGLRGGMTPAPPKADEDLIDLPAPVRGKREAFALPDDLPAPVARPLSSAPPPEVEIEVIDLPAPSPSRSQAPVVDLPAPRGPAPRPGVINFPNRTAEPQRPDGGIDLLTPKGGPSVGIDLDAPDVDDLVAPVRSVAAPRPLPELDDTGPPPVDLEALDVVAPKGAFDMDLAPKLTEIDVVAPEEESMDVTPQTMDVAPVDKPPPVHAVTGEAPRYVPEDGDEGGVTPRLRVPRGALVIGGGAVLLAAVGVSLGLFTGAGFFGANLFSGRHAVEEATVAGARKLMAEDTLPSYNKAVVALKPLVEASARNHEAAAVEAQAHLGAAWLGISAESKSADKSIATLPAGSDEPSDARKARALRALVAGKLPEARTLLAQVLSRAPSDAVALGYLGLLELSSGDPAAAEKLYAKSLAAEPDRARALYGMGAAKERLGDATGAKDAYTRALARSPNHFGAALGLLRLEARAPTRTGEVPPARRIAEMIDKRALQVGPREVAEAWTSLGVIAARSGRREEAEDRLKRALKLDPDSTTAQLALARVQCDQGRANDALPALRKLAAAQQKNLEARLAFVRALVESKSENAASESLSALAPAVAAAPKDARVLYWQGRVALVQDKIDREAALQKFKEAVAADSRYLPAYMAESTTLAQLGRADDALTALREAASRAAGDPPLLTELGEAYLGLGRALDAEGQFRTALDAQPDYYTARMDLGAALEAQNKLDAARAAYEQVFAAAPEFPGLAERRGRVAVRLGHKDEAAALFEKALGQGVPTHSLRLAAGNLDLDLGKVADAQKLADQVLHEDDRSAAAHLLAARAWLAAGHADDAVPEARRAASLSDLPEAHLTLGRALESLGKLDMAVIEYQLARRAPVEAEATLGRARIMVRMGASKDALSELNALINDNHLRAEALMLVGDCYSDLQQRDRAHRSYEAAVHFGPTLGEAAFKYGRSLHDDGKRRPAIEMLERAIKLGGDKAPYTAEATLLIGDAHREMHENDAAVRAYKRYLELAPPDAPARVEVTRHISLLGGG